MRIIYDWARNLSVEPNRNSYVSSFVKNAPKEEMFFEYGKNVYGFKTDRISDVLSPIFSHPKYGFMFGQVVCYDILYSHKEAQEEINYLCKIIDMFKIDNNSKNEFLNEIIQYWILSFKDKKWSSERERRYELIIYRDYNYLEMTTDERFLKLKSTIFMYPDFILKNNNNYSKVKTNRLRKLSSLSTKPYLFCNDCLQNDYDNAIDINTPISCSICGSKDVSLMGKDWFTVENR